MLVLAVAALIMPTPDTAQAVSGWSATGSLNQYRYGHTATLLPNGKVLVAGGWHADSHAELYDPATRTWTVTGPMNGGHRNGHIAVLLPNGKVLVAGGQWPGTSYSSTAELYDPSTGTWSLTGSMTIGRGNGPAATLLPNGKVLVAGGSGIIPSPYYEGALSSAELYDPATGTWTATGSMANRRDSHVQELLPNGKVLVAAGGTGGGGSTATAELYDPATGMWSPTASLPMPLTHPRSSALRLPNGKVLVAGGDGGGAVAAANLYDSTTGTWTATGSMTTPRTFQTMTLMADGRVLAAGGFHVPPPYYVSTAEIYNPGTGTWTPTAGMGSNRAWATATLLPDGTVLAAGGYDNGLGSAELYEGVPAAVACAPGTFSSTGNEPCTPAAAGTYVATSGATAATACPVGTSSLAGATACSPIQSLSILGGQGAVGSQDPNTQWSADVVVWDSGISSTGAWHFTGNPNPVWRPAYRVSGHPWGQVPGTNTWMNCGPSTNSSECGASGGNVVAFRVQFSIPATLTGLNAKLWINSDNAGTYYLNGTQITDRLVGGGGTGANQVGPSGCAGGSAPYCPAGSRAALNSALQPGVNELLVVVEDWGGLSGFNFRADITGLGTDPIIIVAPTPSDTTPPVITPTVTGTLGDSGWYTSNVDVSWTVTDPNSAVTSTTGCDATTVSTDTAGQTFTCTATSTGGTASQSVTVKRDATAPTASAAAAPAPNGNGWNNTDVTVTFTGTDGLSGIASCLSPVVLGEGAGQSATGTCSDQAGNVSAPATASNINVDETTPVVAVTGVTNGATYIVGGVPAAGCTTNDALSGVATSATLSTAGGPLGSVTVTCAGGTDKAGNTAAAVTATYSVGYAFCGFNQPLLVPVQEFKAGSTIPVKFCLKDASGAIVTTATGTVEAYVDGVLKGTVAFRFSDGQYIANVQTKDGKTDWPTGALELRVKPNDGTTHSTNALSTAGVKGGLKLK